MNKNIFALLVSVLLTTLGLAQQQGTVTGNVIAADKSPVANAMVTINETKLGTYTNSIGKFEITNIETGIYILRVSAAGFKIKEVKFFVSANQNTTVPTIILKNDTETLEEIQVAGAKNRYTKKESEYVSRMPIKNLENSQVYNVVTKELIKDQLATTQDDAMKNAAGIYQLGRATNRAGDGGSFYTSRGFVTQSLLRNGIVGKVTNNPDVINLERIETIKGPSATLFGSILTSYGGLINRVTKKPYDRFGGEIGFQTGSYSFNRLTADINTPVNADHTALFRINASYNNTNTFQDYGFSRSYFFAPTFSYQVNDRLNVSVDAELSDLEASPSQQIYVPFGSSPSAIGVFNAKDLDINYKRSFTGGEFIMNNKSANIYAQANYKMSSNWTSQSLLSSSSNKSNGTQIWFNLLPNKEMARQAWNAIGKDNLLEFQQNFNGEFKIGSVRNRVLIGGDVLNVETKGAYGFLNDVAQFDIVNYSGANANYSNFNPTNVDPLFVGGFVYKEQTNVTTLSTYAADVINITDQLIVSGALRFDHFIDKGLFDAANNTTTGAYSQNALSPKVGVVYQVVKDQLSVFGNYQNSFKNIGYKTAYVNNVLQQQKFDPETATQFEGGIKANAFENKLSANLSYYDIQVNNILRPDPASPGGNGNIQDGNQISKGYELEVTANPIAGLNFIIGYAKNDSKMQKVADANLNGLRPTTAGPETLVNYWLSYNLQASKIKGLGFGIGGNYAGETLIFNQRVAGKLETFTLPSYAILNASINYDQPKYRLSVKMDNITDELYFVGNQRIEVQAPRTVMGSLIYKF